MGFFKPRRWWGMISQCSKWESKGGISGRKKERGEKRSAWREDQRLNEGNEVILQRADLVYQSFREFSFGKGSKHYVNLSK